MASGERVYTGPRVRKLGMKPGLRVMLVDIDDDTFAAEVAEEGVELVTAPPVDVVFLGVRTVADLRGIVRHKRDLPPDGALWLVRPKGKDSPVTEAAAMTAGLDSGLVDVKVVSFSPTHSALKYVYRMRDR